MSITPNDTRKKFLMESKRNIKIDSKKCLPCDKCIPFENHIWDSVLAWINVNDPTNPLAPKSSIYFPVNNVRSTTIDDWKYKLVVNGYDVKINDNKFTISIQ